MFSYLITAIAVVLCLLGALAIFGNFGALLEAQQNGKALCLCPVSAQFSGAWASTAFPSSTHFRLLVCRGVAGYWRVDTAFFADLYGK